MSWEELTHEERIWYPIACVVLLMLSGLCSGLTIGIFSISLVDMQVMRNTGTEKERSRGRRLVPLLEHSNQTLVTLLVANTICMQALPIMLEDMVGEIYALLISVTGLLFFGEVLPQATFVRHNVAICAFLTPFVYLAGILTFPLTFPLALILDKTVGTSDNVVTRDYVAGAVARAFEAAAEGEFDGLAPHEVRVMRGAMQLSERRIRELPVVKVDDAFMLEATQVLTPEITQRILDEGYSRIPVYLGSRNHVIGVLVVKALVALAYTPGRKWSIVELPLREPIRMYADCRVLDLYQAFKTGQSHLAAVYDRLGSLTGFVTLEDVFELVHQCAIRDEGDADDEQEAVLAIPAQHGGGDLSVSYNGAPHTPTSPNMPPGAHMQMMSPSARLETRDQRRRRDQLLVSVYESVRASRAELSADPTSHFNRAAASGGGGNGTPNTSGKVAGGRRS